ncbi:hypothetical protein A1F94_002320, partial [Pyrenophora tritici-repentis]
MEAYNVKTRWAPGHMKMLEELADQLADSEAKDPHQPYGMAASPTRSGIRTVGRRLLEHTRDTWWQDKSSRLSACYISTSLLSSIAIAAYFLNSNFTDSVLFAWTASTRSVFEVLWEELDHRRVGLEASLAGSAIDCID